MSLKKLYAEVLRENAMKRGLFEEDGSELSPEMKKGIESLLDDIEALLDDIEDELEDESKEQNEGVLTTIGFIAAFPSILKIVSNFGRKITPILTKAIGKKPADSAGAEEWFQKLGEKADEIHHLYIVPFESLMKKFVKDEKKAKKLAYFLFHLVVASLLISAGVTAFKAIKSNNLSLATLEAALSAIKSGEIKDYLSKVLS